MDAEQEAVKFINVRLREEISKIAPEPPYALGVLIVRRQSFPDRFAVRTRECLAPWFDVKRPQSGDANAVFFPWSRV